LLHQDLDTFLRKKSLNLGYIRITQLLLFYDVSKLSFATIGHLLDTYGLLRSGAALGRGCGPLIVARPGFGPEQLVSKKIQKFSISARGSIDKALLNLKKLQNETKQL
jgi:predicted solute-binding protein